MKFKQLLLYLLQRFQQQRTVSAPFHLLKGKKSGQTIQDVGLFSLYPYFSLLPKLSRARFDEAIQALVIDGTIIVHEQGAYEVLAERVKDVCYFNGWHYRGNEHVFFARLSLVVQTLSQQQANDMRFVPLQKDESVQAYVRDFLRWAQYDSGTLGTVLKEELTIVCEELDDEAAQLLLLRLSGANVPGYSWAQLAHYRQEELLDTQLTFISALHHVLRQIELQNVPLLQALTQHIKVEAFVTQSAQQTAQLHKAGYTIAQIAQMRRLKESTIEDHIVEMAMSEEQFELSQFVDVEEVKKVWALVQSLNTRKLKIIKERLPHLTYFQLRLILAKGGQ